MKTLKERLSHKLKSLKVAYRHKVHYYNYPKKYQVQIIILRAIDSCIYEQQMEALLKYIELYEKKTKKTAGFIRYVFNLKLQKLQQEPDTYVVQDNPWKNRLTLNPSTQ